MDALIRRNSTFLTLNGTLLKRRLQPPTKCWRITSNRIFDTGAFQTLITVPLEANKTYVLECELDATVEANVSYRVKVLDVPSETTGSWSVEKVSGSTSTVKAANFDDELEVNTVTPNKPVSIRAGLSTTNSGSVTIQILGGVTDYVTVRAGSFVVLREVDLTLLSSDVSDNTVTGTTSIFSRTLDADKYYLVDADLHFTVDSATTSSIWTVSLPPNATVIGSMAPAYFNGGAIRMFIDAGGEYATSSGTPLSMIVLNRVRLLVHSGDGGDIEFLFRPSNNSTMTVKRYSWLSVRDAGSLDILGSDHTNSSNSTWDTLASIPTLDNGAYVFGGFYPFKQPDDNNTIGIGLRLALAGSSASFGARFDVAYHVTHNESAWRGDNTHYTQADGPGNTTKYFAVDGLVYGASAGSLDLEFRSEVNSWAITVVAGGFCWREAVHLLSA